MVAVPREGRWAARAERGMAGDVAACLGREEGVAEEEACAVEAVSTEAVSTEPASAEAASTEPASAEAESTATWCSFLFY